MAPPNADVRAPPGDDLLAISIDQYVSLASCTLDIVTRAHNARHACDIYDRPGSSDDNSDNDEDKSSAVNSESQSDADGDDDHWNAIR